THRSFKALSFPHLWKTVGKTLWELWGKVWKVFCPRGKDSFFFHHFPPQCTMFSTVACLENPQRFLLKFQRKSSDFSAFPHRLLLLLLMYIYRKTNRHENHGFTRKS